MKLKIITLSTTCIFFYSSCDHKNDTGEKFEIKSSQNETDNIIQNDQIFYYPLFLAETTSCPLEIMLPSGRYLSISFNNNSSDSIMKDFYFLENSQKFMKHGEYSNLYIGGQVILDSPEKKNNDDHDVTYQFRLVDFFILDNNNKLTKHDLGDGYKYIQDKKFVEIGLILKEEATPIEATQTKYFLNKVTEWRRSYVR